MLTVTPGMKTSEFLLAVLNVVAMIVASAQDYISDNMGVGLSVAGGIAYIVSRGLAKTETRTTETPPAG